jgi:hypothetical protein
MDDIADEKTTREEIRKLTREMIEYDKQIGKKIVEQRIRGYGWIFTDNYYDAMKEFSKYNSTPLTFKENIEARVNDYNTQRYPNGTMRGKKARLELFNFDLSSATGIANDDYDREFAIIPKCEQVINFTRPMNRGLKRLFLGRYPKGLSNHYKVPLKTLPGNVEVLDQRLAKYNEPLTKKEVLNHPAWRAACDDSKLLKEYADIVFSEYKRDRTMPFCPTAGLPDHQRKSGWGIMPLALGKITYIGLWQNSNPHYDNSIAKGHDPFLMFEKHFLRKID